MSSKQSKRKFYKERSSVTGGKRSSFCSRSGGVGSISRSIRTSMREPEDKSKSSEKS